jgi:hypothetical protein
MMRIEGNTGFLIHRIQPSEKGDRVNFLILVPLDCGCITGISMTASPGFEAHTILSALPNPPLSAGKLSLRLRNKGDIFFQATVPSGLNWEDNYRIAGINPVETALQGKKWLWTSGTRFDDTQIKIETDQKAILGFYVDELNLRLNKKETYTVDIFLRYQKRP